MHYEDLDYKKQWIILVVYNHEILSCNKRSCLKKDGTLSKKYVDYQITSIQRSGTFNPLALKKILNDPYAFFNKEFSYMYHAYKKFNENFWEIKIAIQDGYTPVISTIKNVTNDKNFLKQLH